MSQPVGHAASRRKFLEVSARAAAVAGTSCALPAWAQGSGGQGGAVGSVEVAATVNFRPTAVVLNSQGRMFVTNHWFDRKEPQLLEVAPDGRATPFPTPAWNRGFGAGDDALHQPLGMAIDSRDRLWLVDPGLFPPVTDGGPVLPPQSPRVIGFDTKSGAVVANIKLAADVAPPGVYPQDLAVDERRGFAYLADIGGVRKPALIVVNLDNGRARRFEDHPSMRPELVDLRLEGKALTFPDAQGRIQTARIGINPVTLSADGSTLFFGPMCGLGWYAMPTEGLRSGASDAALGTSIRRIANKPVCNGATTDARGNHYLTNVGDNAIDMIDANGRLTRLAQDDRLIWPDGLFMYRGWLYTGVNQLNRSALFNAGKEGARPPYLILRIRAEASA
jgi:hypothetical protein